MKVLGVIPARLASTRLPEKVLKRLGSKPMIQHVWERVKQAKQLDDVVIACDDQRIEACAIEFGATVWMTRADHLNGSSRVAEVAGRSDADVLINVQGDEPLINPESIDQLADIFKKEESVQVATLAVRLEDQEAYRDPNVVKVVCDKRGNALYFSRAMVPFNRDKSEEVSFLKHQGIYGYRKKFLLDFIEWPCGVLEQVEKLEQLRILENGFEIRVLETKHDSCSVDTEEDLRRVEAKIIGSRS